MTRSWLVRLALVFGIALAVRGVAATRVAIIERDGIDYLAAASRFARGDRAGGLAHHYPPAYPLLVAAVARASGSEEPDETSGEVASVVAGAFLALAVAAAGELALGARSGFLAGLVAALHPSVVEQAAKVTADPLFSALALGAVACGTAGLAGKRPRALLPLAGALAAASYLARPEGILLLGVLALVALLPRRASASLRLRDALLVLAPALLVAGAYVVAIKPHADLNGGEAGAWKLTKKRELFLEAGGERVFPRGLDGARHVSVAGAAEVGGAALERAVKQVGFTLVEGNLVLVLALAGAFGWPRRRRGAVLAGMQGETSEARRALARIVVGSTLALLAAYALIRSDPRYGAILFAFALPFAGRGVDLALDRLSPRRKAWRAALAALLLVHLFVAVRVRLVRKEAWRDAGEACHGFHADTVAAADPRVAFYARAKLVDLVPLLRETESLDPDARAREVLGFARARGAQALVVAATRESDKALVRAIELRLKDEQGGRAPTRYPIERVGAESVEVFALDL